MRLISPTEANICDDTGVEFNDLLVLSAHCELAHQRKISGFLRFIGTMTQRRELRRSGSNRP